MGLQSQVCGLRVGAGAFDLGLQENQLSHGGWGGAWQSRETPEPRVGCCQGSGLALPGEVCVEVKMRDVGARAFGCECEV